MDHPGSFYDPFAAVLDAILNQQDKDPHPGDVGFYMDLATEADGPALEVGVGTGRVYLELLDAGIDVDGFDISEQSLKHLRSKADDRGHSPTVWVDDATNFEVSRDYGLIYAPGRVFNHLYTIEQQKQALLSIRDALNTSGRLALNTFIPQFDVVENYGEPQTDEVTIDSKQYRVVCTTYLIDEVEQITKIHRELYCDGELVAEREIKFALIPKRQFELLFEVAGFSSWTAKREFEGAPRESVKQEVIWIVEN